jgi:DNA primase
MQTANLSFPETVEALAREAGLEVPKASPEERAQAERHSTLQSLMAAACSFFEAELQGPAGRDALAYLHRRGLDDDTIRRFRLGYAPESRDALKRALGKDFPEPMLIEGGLLRPGESGSASYDYFRHRVIFPIGDRSGRPIAFGGRVMGEGQPKYLNSPDTPLFHKGRVLYGWALARAAAAKTPSAIVTEGYMDVIALHRAGFDTAVAPLGTALTEAQLEALWRLAPEPVLCFDGDAAGIRAAGRALERALPMLAPGRSLRFASLPPGEDPDTLILRQGSAAMRDLLDAARPLAEMIWMLESAAGPLDTPERRAALEQRLETRVRAIADRAVQEHYRRFFRERLFESRGLAAGGRRAGRGRTALRPGRRPAFRDLAPSHPFEGQPLKPKPASSLRRMQEVLLAVLLNHPVLLHDVAEELSQVELPAPDLDKLCRELLNIVASRPELDAEALRLHLCQDGFAATVDSVLSPQVLDSFKFVRRDAGIEIAREGWAHIRGQFQSRQLALQIEQAERDCAADATEEAFARLEALRRQREEQDAATTELLR